MALGNSENGLSMRPMNIKTETARPTVPMRGIEVIRLTGCQPYRDVYELQVERRKAVEAGQLGNALFLLEHTPVLTLGRNFAPSSLLRSEEEIRHRGIDVFPVDRGGDVTYHGPGQLVAYPILNLQEWRPSIGWYLRSLETVIIRVLEEFGLSGTRLEGFTGVWVEGAKVAAIGVGLHNWVTFHGIALNVDPDMRHFGLIVPCGIADKPVTSMKQLLGRQPDMQKVMDTFEREFIRVFEAVRTAR